MVYATLPNMNRCGNFETYNDGCNSLDGTIVYSNGYAFARNNSRN